jgi:transposase
MLEDTQDHEEIIERVAALDVGKAELVACIRVPSPDTPARRAQEICTHSTMTRSLLRLADRLRELAVTRVVMEATSDYRKPVFYPLEAHGLDPWPVNAKDVKHLPGAAQDRQVGCGVAVQGRRTADASPQLPPATADPPAA